MFCSPSWRQRWRSSSRLARTLSPSSVLAWYGRLSAAPDNTALISASQWIMIDSNSGALSAWLRGKCASLAATVFIPLRLSRRLHRHKPLRRGRMLISPSRVGSSSQPPSKLLLSRVCAPHYRGLARAPSLSRHFSEVSDECAVAPQRGNARLIPCYRSRSP